MTLLPPGLYDTLIDGALAEALSDLSKRELNTVTYDLEGEGGSDFRHDALVARLRSALVDVLDEIGTRTDMAVERELEIVVAALSALRRGGSSEDFPRPLSLLQAITRPDDAPLTPPRTGLRRPWLFTSGRHDPPLLDELRRELTNVDHVDILVSFITWSGVRKIRDLIQRATTFGADGIPRTKFRILTTTYIGATEAKAVQWLAEQPGVKLRISLDGRRTRLHAKAWIFRRATGFGTAYVGSANLSGAALTGGLEWTMKTTQSAEPELFETAVAHFETLWEDREFTAYNPSDETHLLQLRSALRRECGIDEAIGEEAPVTFFTLQPKAYQQAMLDRLTSERRHGRMRNLLVAATGTGKTVVAAFDYLASCKQEGGRPRLLFIAHRKEILQQARATFIQVLREPGFGVICAGGGASENYDHCFCTIQSFASRSLNQRFGSDHWHTVIVDECHHMTADSYGQISKLQPSILLGLTATPERADGARLDALFDMRLDGGPAAELRLWEALDQQLLAPFEYYGVDDTETDFSSVQWGQPRLEEQQLASILNANHARSQVVLAAVDQYVSEPQRMKALAFCVSVEHAHFMAKAFNKGGIVAEVVVGKTSNESRRNAPVKLARGEIQVICTCDLYNEGVDIPDVDTLLILRPTQSPVLIQQQLGRGLRLAPGKESCLVLDLVGRHNAEFRFDRLFGLLSGLPRKELEDALEHGFSKLPPGCHIHLDRLTREQVLRNLHNLSINSWRHLVAETKAWLSQGPDRRDADLATFLRDTGIEMSELYRGGNNHTARGWAALRRECGVEQRSEGQDEAQVSHRIAANINQQDDPALLRAVKWVAEGQVVYETLDEPDQRRFDAVSAELYPSRNDAVPGSDLSLRLADAPALRDELSQFVDLIDDMNDLLEQPLPGVPADWPFHLHCSYNIRTIALFTGKLSPNKRDFPREGVIRFPDQKIEILLVTLDKSTGFKASTSYHDYAISPERFHWQSQNSTSPESPAGLRYINGASDGWIFQLFVREVKNQPYRALGPVSYESHSGAKPMSIQWRLQEPIPLARFRQYSVLREG
jgi:superfamily II DNA or RNA helicase/HKD family nuclease